MFLTNEELAELTGYKVMAYQVKWLTERGWVFERTAGGRVVVLRAYAERMLGMPGKATTWEPNWDALEKAQKGSK